MFETSGIIGRKELYEMMEQDMPRLNRITILATGALILLALLFPFGSFACTALLFSSLTPFGARKLMRRYYIHMNLALIYRISGSDQLTVTTSFDETGALMYLPNQVQSVSIPYSEMTGFMETPSLFCLSTNTRQAVYIFKEQLRSREEWLSFLKGQHTAIPASKLN